MSETDVGPAALAARLIRRPSVTPRDEGALAIVAEALEASASLATASSLAAAPAATRSTTSMPATGPAGPISALPVIPTSCPPGRARPGRSIRSVPTLRDGALCGRGAVDMKGAIAAFIAAMRDYLDEQGSAFAGSISLLITGDEEGAAFNGTRKVLEWLAQRGEAPRRLPRR